MLLAVLLTLVTVSSTVAGEIPQHPDPFKNLPRHVLDALAAGGEVTIDHEYQHGVRTKSTYRGADWHLLDRTVDPSGVVLSERDAAGLEIAYAYDQLHRVTAVKPSAAHGGAWVQIRHSIASTGPKMELFYRPNGSMTATPIAREELYFDGFGRLWKERRLMPGAVWAERITERHVSGELKRVSTWHGGGKPARWTTYSDYDAFGRPGSITQPDGARVDYVYRGIREVVRTQQVATSEHGQTSYSTIERYDARGRLLQVVEPEDGAEARYTYDVADRLRVATIKPRGGGASQERRWDFDGRGFLRSEEHPESGRTAYGLYDARGRARRVIDGTGDLNRSRVPRPGARTRRSGRADRSCRR
ncbi:MAG: RHS repeat domain-containing protein [Acidobacteriota bacterium]